jgi:hypothetical protein
MYQLGKDGKQEPKSIVRDEYEHPLLKMAIEKIEKELWVNDETGEIVLGQGPLQPHQLNRVVGSPPIDDSANKADQKMDEILELLKTKNIYDEPINSIESNGELKVVDIDVKKQIAINKVSTEALESEEFDNTVDNKLDKLRKLRNGN